MIWDEIAGCIEKGKGTNIYMRERGWQLGANSYNVIGR